MSENERKSLVKAGQLLQELQDALDRAGHDTVALRRALALREDLVDLMGELDNDTATP